MASTADRSDGVNSQEQAMAEALGTYELSGLGPASQSSVATDAVITLSSQDAEGVSPPMATVLTPQPVASHAPVGGAGETSLPRRIVRASGFDTDEESAAGEPASHEPHAAAAVHEDEAPPPREPRSHAGAARVAKRRNQGAAAHARARLSNKTAPTGGLRTVGTEAARALNKATVRRLARRAGVQRVSGLVYDMAQELVTLFLRTNLRTTVLYTEHRGSRTVSAVDVVHGVKQCGRTLYGVGPCYMNSIL